MFQKKLFSVFKDTTMHAQTKNLLIQKFCMSKQFICAMHKHLRKKWNFALKCANNVHIMWSSNKFEQTCLPNSKVVWSHYVCIAQTFVCSKLHKLLCPNFFAQTIWRSHCVCTVCAIFEQIFVHCTHSVILA
jgi:hypothetical protein